MFLYIIIQMINKEDDKRGSDYTNTTHTPFNVDPIYVSQLFIFVPLSFTIIT